MQAQLWRARVTRWQSVASIAALVAVVAMLLTVAVSLAAVVFGQW
jgi:hypothetical protein